MTSCSEGRSRNDFSHIDLTDLIGFRSNARPRQIPSWPVMKPLTTAQPGIGRSLTPAVVKVILDSLPPLRYFGACLPSIKCEKKRIIPDCLIC